MTISDVLKTVQSGVPDCLASALIDVKSQAVVAYASDFHRREVLSLLASPTSELFQGENVRAVERMFGRIRGTEDEEAHTFEEIAIYSDNLLHVFQRCGGQPGAVLVTVCRSDANLAMVMLKSRELLVEVCSSLVAMNQSR